MLKLLACFILCFSLSSLSAEEISPKRIAPFFWLPGLVLMLSGGGGIVYTLVQKNNLTLTALSDPLLAASNLRTLETLSVVSWSSIGLGAAALITGIILALQKPSFQLNPNSPYSLVPVIGPNQFGLLFFAKLQ